MLFQYYNYLVTRLTGIFASAPFRWHSQHSEVFPISQSQFLVRSAQVNFPGLESQQAHHSNFPGLLPAMNPWTLFHCNFEGNR